LQTLYLAPTGTESMDRHEGCVYAGSAMSHWCILQRVGLLSLLYSMCPMSILFSHWAGVLSIKCL